MNVQLRVVSAMDYPQGTDPTNNTQQTVYRCGTHLGSPDLVNSRTTSEIAWFIENTGYRVTECSKERVCFTGPGGDIRTIYVGDYLVVTRLTDTSMNLTDHQEATRPWWDTPEDDLEDMAVDIDATIEQLRSQLADYNQRRRNSGLTRDKLTASELQLLKILNETTQTILSGLEDSAV